MTKLSLIVLSVALAACSNQRPEEQRAPVQAGASGPMVGSAAPSPASGAAPSGGTSGTGNAAGGTAEPSGAATNPAAIGCATPVPLSCEAGFADGCTGGLTAVHVCVAANTKAGPPCVQEIALSCPPGQIDACLHAPPLANHHLCIVVPKTTP